MTIQDWHDGPETHKGRDTWTDEALRAAHAAVWHIALKMRSARELGDPGLKLVMGFIANCEKLGKKRKAKT